MMLAKIREARPKDAEAIARIHWDSWRSTYRGLLPNDYLDNLDFDERLRRWQRPFTDHNNGEFVYVAEDETGHILGFASGGALRIAYRGFDGELWALHISKLAQRQGLGKRLIGSVANRLAELGYKSMFVWVVEGNSASAFYEGLGARYLTKHEEHWAGMLAPEAGYGFSDLEPLCKLGRLGDAGAL